VHFAISPDKTRLAASLVHSGGVDVLSMPIASPGDAVTVASNQTQWVPPVWTHDGRLIWQDQTGANVHTADAELTSVTTTPTERMSAVSIGRFVPWVGDDEVLWVAGTTGDGGAIISDFQLVGSDGALRGGHVGLQAANADNTPAQNVGIPLLSPDRTTVVYYDPPVWMTADPDAASPVALTPEWDWTINGPSDW
jgi:hypothetical protein